jgi:outer membrane protein OmpA-like peptidoglycan-associated protein
VIRRLRQFLRATLNHPFALVAVIYIGLVFSLFVWRLGWSDPARDYVASRELVKNHRIVSGDITRPEAKNATWRRPGVLAAWLGFYMSAVSSIEGKYVKAVQPIMPGESVSTVVLADKPDMELPDRMHAIAFPLPADSRLIGLLDAGSPVVLLGQDPDSKAAVSVRATVHAVLCEPTNSDAKNCFPILQIPADQSQFVAKNQAALRVALGWPAPAPAPAPAPSPPAPPATPPPRTHQIYVIFFDWGKYDINSERMQIIQLAANQCKAAGHVTLQVTGYTDLSGPAGYNNELSELRAKAVAAALEWLGVPRNEMVVTGSGMNNPHVPAAGGREPQNRRVEIVCS